MILVPVVVVKSLKTVMVRNKNLKMKLTVAIVVLISCIQSYAQGNVTIKEDPKVTKIMDLYLKINRSVTHISGWRITVITTTDRRLMEQTRMSFQQQFNLKTKWDYKEPYYYLKAGAFMSRAEASYSLEAIKKKFHNAFLSSDKIAYEEL
jgi:hypothetical protein